MVEWLAIQALTKYKLRKIVVATLNENQNQMMQEQGRLMRSISNSIRRYNPFRIKIGFNPNESQQDEGDSEVLNPLSKRQKYQFSKRMVVDDFVKSVYFVIGHPTPGDWPELHRNGNKQMLKELEKYQNCKPSLRQVMRDATPSSIDWIYRMIQLDLQKEISVIESLLDEYFYNNPMPEEILFLRQLDHFKRKQPERTEKQMKLR